MTPEGHNDLQPLLQRYLQESDKPLTCHDLFDKVDVKAVAPSSNRVSDYLGVMFRKGLLSRVASGGESKARWAYMWREKATPEWRANSEVEVRDYRPKPILDRPNVYITEDGSHIKIEMPEISIQIQLKPKK